MLVVDLGIVLPVPKRAQQSITDLYFLIKHDKGPDDKAGKTEAL